MGLDHKALNDSIRAISGDIGDAAGYAMRGGEIYVEGNAGYRAGVHMKAYRDRVPAIVIGGRAGSFLGEYQAGGVILVLGLHTDGRPLVSNFPCTGMHGGKLFLRGICENILFPRQVSAQLADEAAREEIRPYVEEYCRLFGADFQSIFASPFIVVTPDSKNPYHQMFVPNYVTHPDGRSLEVDARSILKGAVAAAREAGVSFDFGAEMEFYLFKTDENGNATREPYDPSPPRTMPSPSSPWSRR